jgi:hypothetical protein
MPSSNKQVVHCDRSTIWGTESVAARTEMPLEMRRRPCMGAFPAVHLWLAAWSLLERRISTPACSGCDSRSRLPQKASVRHPSLTFRESRSVATGSGIALAALERSTLSRPLLPLGRGEVRGAQVQNGQVQSERGIEHGASSDALRQANP